MPSLIDKSGNLVYFGRLSWGNFVDWLVTLCLGGIIGVTALLLGGVRPDTQVLLLPLFALLLVLHGLWLAVDRDGAKRLSHVPLLFVPFLIWMGVNVLGLSPTAWRGWYELIAALEVFIFVWVLSNNVRTRAHLWVLLVLALAPVGYAVFIGFFQFFQNPAKLATALTQKGFVEAGLTGNLFAGYTLELNPDFLGQATGSFADPSSFAVLLLVLLPSLLIAAIVPRLPGILRVFCLYVALMLVVGVLLAQVLWTVVLIVPILVMVPWFCFQKKMKRWRFGGLGAVLLILLVLPVVLLHPRFRESVADALAEDGERVRFVLWQEALDITMEAPLTGAGGGSFSAQFEQSPRVSLPALPVTPHNDYLLLLSEYGALGACLFLLPFAFVVVVGLRRWKAEPYRAKLKEIKGAIMPATKLFLSVGLSGVLVFAICAACTFVFYVPALALYGALFFGVLIKSSFNRRLSLPEGGLLRMAYLCLGCLLAWGGLGFAFPRLEAQALELQARQRLDQIVEQRVHVSGNSDLLDRVIEQYEAAVLLDSRNADAWLGLSSAYCQQFFRNPANFEQLGELAAAHAQRGIDLSDSYWEAWAQLGIAQSLSGDVAEAEAALTQALSLAPNNSNAHYYWASYLSNFPPRRTDAIAAVQRALEINPNNASARRLQQKLLIL